MSRRIRRDTHKRVSSSGYQQMQGDLEVQGNLLGPAITNLNAAIAKISATSTTPVKLGAPVLEGGMRSITIRWGRQYNLANFSHYELQVSDDDESWYSLLLDGTGWKGNLSEDTDVKTEVFTHANIPLVEDAGDLVGISLYYRVRQVTFAEVRGEWSDSAYATTKGVQDVVLTDSRHRYIEISSKKGIYADDRQGHVIHDIPNAPVTATTEWYLGHILWCTNHVALLGGVQAGSSSTWVYIVAGGNTNAKGVLINWRTNYTFKMAPGEPTYGLDDPGQITLGIDSNVTQYGFAMVALQQDYTPKRFGAAFGMVGATCYLYQVGLLI